jgi:hypothetical protein
MNGKDLALALAVAALVGGAAGAAVSLALVPKAEATSAAVPPDVLYRLKNAEEALAKTKAALEDSRKSVNELSERVAAAEIKSAKPAPGGAPGASARTMRIGRHRDTAADATAAAGPQVEVEGGDGDFAVQLGSAVIGDSVAAVSGDFGGFQAGMALRKLPEADRWQKAKDDLGLTWNQVEALKKAVADRDAAMKDAMTTDKVNKTDGSGGSFTIQRPDAGKAAHAEADYHDRVDAALTADQKKSWNSKGYDHAFGSNPFGGVGATMVMSFGASSEKKDAK